MNDIIIEALFNLISWIKKESYRGYDPYDALNSEKLFSLNNRWMRIASTVAFRLSPINLRPFFYVEKGLNPKGMGLFLSSFVNVHEVGIFEKKSEIEYIKKWLINHKSEGYSGYCWGYNFPWQSKMRLLKESAPTVVNTSYISHAFLDYYDLNHDKEALKIARSACDFILKDLKVIETKEGICFSYTPFEENIVHNANVLGASLLARVYIHTKEDILLEKATNSIDFTISHQLQDGRWDYSINQKTGKANIQTDWHQGFILDSLIWYIDSTNPKNDKYLKSLKKGIEFYKKQFDEQGRSYWRYPRKWPIDIHNQAQGIFTFSKLEKLIPGSIKFAEKIVKWTIENMKDEEGYFYYQKWPFFTNKIPYMRWSQAWMMVALSRYLLNNGEKL